MRIIYLFIAWLVSFGQGNCQPLQSGYVVLETHLPIVAIRTQNQSIENEPKIDAKMAIIHNEEGHTNIYAATFYDYPLNIGIEIRGESSQYFYPKKSYSIETRDSIGDNLNISILGLPKENDWILYGPYGDKSMLRNLIVYNLASKMMDWGPKLKFCELVINNQYQGVYLFGESVKRDKNRIDIAKLVEKDTTGDDLSGGYIIRIDKGEQDNYNGWYSSFRPNNSPSQRIYFQYYYPKLRNILPEQKKYIQDYMRGFEDALHGENFKDPVIGYTHYTDVESFVDFFILNELSKNVDGYRLSAFLYKDKKSNGGKLHVGPVWDFNLGFGNANYDEGFSSTGWAYHHNLISPNDYWPVPFWWERLLEDPRFRNQLKTRWMGLREGPICEDSIYAFINQSVSELGTAIGRNYVKWPILGRWVWPNYYVGESYQDEIDELKRWISERIDWMDTYMPGMRIISGQEVMNFKTSVALYPNPFRDQISIDLGPNSDYSFEFILFDLSGRELKRIQFHSYEKTLHINDLSPGVYVYKVKQQGLILDQGKLVRN
jgi:hypothetical protein